MYLYHGSPSKLTVLKPTQPRGFDEFTKLDAVFLTDNKKEAMLYAIARDKKRENKGWAIFKNKLYILNKHRPFKFNKKGYLYTITNKVDCIVSSDHPHQYAILCPVEPDKWMEVFPEDIVNDVAYIDEKGKKNLERRMLMVMMGRLRNCGRLSL